MSHSCVTQLFTSVKSITAALLLTCSISYFHDLTGLMEGYFCFFTYLMAVAIVSSCMLFCLEPCIHVATFVMEGGRK